MKNKCNFHRKVIKIQNLADRFNGRFKWLKRNSVKWKRVDKKYPEYPKSRALKAQRDETFALRHEEQKTADGSPVSITEQGGVGVPHTDSQAGFTFTPLAVVCSQRHLVPESQDPRSCHIGHGHPTVRSVHVTRCSWFSR